jgi:hypothetical protein
MNLTRCLILSRCAELARGIVQHKHPIAFSGRSKLPLAGCRELARGGGFAGARVEPPRLAAWPDIFVMSTVNVRLDGR